MEKFGSLVFPHFVDGLLAESVPIDLNYVWLGEFHNLIKTETLG
jgi:hypothetical protein